MSDEVKVMVRYTVKEGELSFTDALYYDLTDYSSIPKATIDNAKVARFNTWKTVINTPPKPIDVDKAIEDCQTQINYYTQQKASYLQQKQASSGGK